MQTPDGQTTFFYHIATGSSHWTLPEPPRDPPPRGKQQNAAAGGWAAAEHGVIVPHTARAPCSAPYTAPAASARPFAHGKGGGSHRTQTLSDLSVHEVSLLVHYPSHHCHSSINSIPPPQHFFQMLGSDHSKYGEAMKQQKIKGLSLASATDDELNDIFRSPMQHEPLQPKLAPHALLHCIL
jgi:hypothetical protein